MMISQLFSIDWVVISFVLHLVMLTAIFYFSGVTVVGSQRVQLRDALVISLLGTIVWIICLHFFGFIVGNLLSLVTWLLLVRRYYETGWLGAIAVGILALIMSVLMTILISVLSGSSFQLLELFPF